MSAPFSLFKQIFEILFSFCAVSSIKTRTVSNASLGESNRNSGKRRFLCVDAAII